MNLACQVCKKQPATVHITDISEQGEKQEKHLCEMCAEEMGAVQQPQKVPLNKILAGLTTNKENAQQMAALRCPSCGLSFVEFRNSGLLGCPNDYEAFEQALLPLIERAHDGATHHIGKVPRGAETSQDAENHMVRLKKELTKAVDAERYEEAAKLRDTISSLEPE